MFKTNGLNVERLWATLVRYKEWMIVVTINTKWEEHIKVWNLGSQIGTEITWTKCEIKSNFKVMKLIRSYTGGRYWMTFNIRIRGAGQRGANCFHLSHHNWLMTSRDFIVTVREYVAKQEHSATKPNSLSWFGPNLWQYAGNCSSLQQRSGVCYK